MKQKQKSEVKAPSGGWGALVAPGLHLLFKRDDAKRRLHDQHLTALLEFGARFPGGEDAAQMMEQTLRVAVRDIGMELGYIMLFDESDNDLRTEIAVWTGQERPFPAARALGDGIEGHVARTGKPAMLARTPALLGKIAGPAIDDLSGSYIAYEGEAVLCVPMIRQDSAVADGDVCGVLTLVSHQPGYRFPPEAVQRAHVLACLATMTIANARRYERLRTSFLRALQAMATALDDKVPYMHGHSHRVAEICVMIANKLGVEPEIVTGLREGALLHEIGKIGIPDAILLKPGQLTEEEADIQRQQPIIGYEICKPLGLGDEILMLVRNQQERLDGTGYPDGLRYDAMPLSLRILCAANAFDAMSSYRPYRKQIDSRERNEQLNRFAGTQFDPIVVETLKSLLNAGELDELYKGHWQPRADESAAVDESDVVELTLLRAA